MLIPEADVIIPSKPKKRFGAGGWLSFRIIKSRRPGAGLHGAVDGGSLPALSASCLRKRYFPQLALKRVETAENILLIDVRISETQIDLVVVVTYVSRSVDSPSSRQNLQQRRRI